MQAIRQTALLNKRELENATPPSASWHADYRDTAWIYVGGLSNDLSEGDVCVIFSQFGNPTHLNLIRDKETGKSKGFGFLKYEDQRSCDLAVDNLGGAEVLGRMLRVDHSRYKRKEGEDEETFRIEAREKEQFGGEDTGGSETDGEGHELGRKRKKRKLLKEEKELEEMLAITAGQGEEEDPMREYLIREKRQEVEKAKAIEKDRRRHKHRHRKEKDGGSKDDDQVVLHHARPGGEDDDRHSRRRQSDRRQGDEDRDHASRDYRDRDVDYSTRKDHKRSNRHQESSGRRQRRNSRSPSSSRSRSRSPGRRT